MKINWNKILWSWPVMVLNAGCFAFMLFVFAEYCHQSRKIKKRGEAEMRKAELKEIIIELKKDSL
jgi:hypothetical protein